MNSFYFCTGFLSGCLFIIMFFYWALDAHINRGGKLESEKYYQDGELTIKSGETFNCERNMYWEKLTIEQGGTLNQNGWRIHAKQVLWPDNMPLQTSYQAEAV